VKPLKQSFSIDSYRDLHATDNNVVAAGQTYKIARKMAQFEVAFI
jgi:hypothetical protein